MPRTLIRVLVWRGFSTQDFKTTRHCALFLMDEGDDAGDALHASGSSQNFVLQRMAGYKPQTSDSLAGSVQVAITSQPLGDLRAIAEQVPVNNRENGWNCQNWVGDALDKLVESRVITAAEKSKALDEMVEILLQGADDQP